jgi:hypothetical protein
MDKVVRDVDVLERGDQRGRIEDVASDDVRVAADTGREVRGVASETANLVAASFESRQQTPSHIAGGAGQQNLHEELTSASGAALVVAPKGAEATVCALEGAGRIHAV